MKRIEIINGEAVCDEGKPFNLYNSAWIVSEDQVAGADRILVCICEESQSLFEGPRERWAFKLSPHISFEADAKFSTYVEAMKYEISCGRKIFGLEREEEMIERMQTWLQGKVPT